MFSKACQYALRSVLYLTIHAHEKNKMGVDELSEELDVPRPFLAKILQQLAKSKVISSSKGRNGGFYLNDKNKSQNLLVVVDSLDGTGVFNECILGLAGCSDDSPCPYHNNVSQYRKEFYHQLESETIEESALRINSDNLKLKNRMI